MFNMYKVVSLGLVLCLLTPAAVSQTKKKVAKHPPVAAKETYQLPGDNGKIGVVYRLGDKGNELYFRLESAQVAPYFKTPDDLVVAGEQERLLVLTYTVQNPQPKVDMMLNSRSFGFTAVSPDDKNYAFGGYSYQPENVRRYQTMLKPAQKVRLVVAVPIYATGPIHKVLVQRDSSTILRYDLEGLVKKMTSTFSPDGLELGNQAKPEFGKPFDVNGFTVEVQKVEPREGPLGTYHAEDGGILFTVQYKITNLQAVSQQLKWTTLQATLTDQNGEKIDWSVGLVSPTSGKEINTDLEPGDSMTCVLVFKGSRSQKPTKLRLVDGNGKRASFIDLP